MYSIFTVRESSFNYDVTWLWLFEDRFHVWQIELWYLGIATTIVWRWGVWRHNWVEGLEVQSYAMRKEWGWGVRVSLGVNYFQGGALRKQRDALKNCLDVVNGLSIEPVPKFNDWLKLTTETCYLESHS